MSIVKRSDENPILIPNREHPWESEAVFNGCPIKKGSEIHLLYRAVSALHYHAESGAQLRVSTIGHGVSRDGIHFKKRTQLILPEEDWERYGCEDPRITKLGGKYYIFYTALSTYPLTPDGIRVGVAVTKDFRTIKKYPVTPFNAKAMALFPEKIDGGIWAILTANTDKPPSKIALARFEREEDIWSPDFWPNWYASLDTHAINFQRSDRDHVEIGAPPIKTKHGWLLIYSYIRNYFSNRKIFGVEAALLDLHDPSKIIARTDMPIMTPEEEYELYGEVPNIVFPSGALLNRGRLHIYYGSADTTCSLATCSLKRLMDAMLIRQKEHIQFERYAQNPILEPIKEHSWESKAVFNPAAWYDGRRTHLLYRAMSDDNTSVFGYAALDDDMSVHERLPDPVYVPRKPFEQKNISGGNSGCEDPRITKLGDRLYVCYTAFDGVNSPRVALTSIGAKDFLNKKWKWEDPVLISPPGIDDKDACVFPQKINGKYVIIHRIGNDIDIAFARHMRFGKRVWLEEHKWLKPRPGHWDSLKVGISAPPLKTKRGWILIYHGVSEDDHIYRVGAVLLDSRDPEHIIGRTDYPLFEPETSYEKQGQVGNVVFPCGAAIINDTVYMYYGGGDSVVGVAYMKVDKLLRILKLSAHA
jgi:predicted GH43/DUF377 family glycosyl hydrolase